MPDGACGFAYRDVAMWRSDKGREQDAVSLSGLRLFNQILVDRTLSRVGRKSEAPSGKFPTT
ncbi:MAG: hypothetical protein ACI9KN_001038 [Gammaproteobacteria bacterium]|jgi:hypothetical protein